jgi:ribosomal protein S18 acetylase RimI-like enzyme|nr:MAG: GNAT family N-acetyltransferase [Leptolyngbya sp. IPPAS B-1204]
MMEARKIVDAYRWQRELGNDVIQTPHGRIVKNATMPDVWDANHASAVTAEHPDDIGAFLGSMERHLPHTSWRVIHTDPFTPEPFVARLALDGYAEQPATIQMVLSRKLRAAYSGDIAPIETEADWQSLAALVRRDHEEGARTSGNTLPPSVTDGIIAGYRAKSGPCRFHLARIDGEPAAYGALVAAPSGAGMIEDLFTLPTYRRRGIASAMIAQFSTALEEQGCTSIFLGALVNEQARHLYAKLGFRPEMLTRCWVRRTT